MTYEYESGVRSAVHVEKEINKGAATSHQVSRIHYSDGRKLQYDYDDMERITRVVDSVADITEYTHDDSNNKAFLCHPAPRRVPYARRGFYITAPLPAPHGAGFLFYPLLFLLHFI